jgi:hypothetical protein
MDVSNVVEIPAFFQDKIVKRLTFTSEGIKVETPGPVVFIASKDISAFRYRITWTRGYKFVFGRQYVIETKDFQNKIFQVKLSSVYGIRRKAYYKVWSDIFNQLWVNYFSNMLNYYLELYSINQIFELAGVNFHADGISWDKKNKLLWHEIALSNYRTYFMIYHTENAYQNKSCSFSMDWNAHILQALLKSIVKQHKQKPELS